LSVTMVLKGAKKRPAASPAGSGRPAKRGAPDHLAVKCTGIEVAIKASSLPNHVKEMLAASVASCLRTYKQDRHEYQKKLLEMVAEVLEGVKASHSATLEAANGKIVGSDLEQEGRQTAFADAQSKLQDLRAEHDEKRTSHTVDIEGVKTATAQKKLSLVDQASGDKASDEAAAKKSKLESAFSAEVFGTFKEKAGSSPAIKNFVKVCLESGFEKALMETVLAVFQKAPEERGTFGNVVVEQVESQFTQQMESFTQALDAATGAKADRAAAVASAEESLQAAVEKRSASAASLEAAGASVKDAKTSLVAAQKALDDIVPELRQARTDTDSVAAALKALESGPLVDFAELLEHAPPPPAPIPEEPSARDTLMAERANEEPVAMKNSPSMKEPVLTEESMPNADSIV